MLVLTNERLKKSRFGRHHPKFGPLWLALSGHRHKVSAHVQGGAAKSGIFFLTNARACAA